MLSRRTGRNILRLNAAAFALRALVGAAVISAWLSSLGQGTAMRRVLAAATVRFQRAPASVSARGPWKSDRIHQNYLNHESSHMAWPPVAIPNLDELRQEAMLGSLQALEPLYTGAFKKQAEAMEYRDSLVEDRQYSSSQIGIFAEEVSSQGQRRFFVNTYAGFAANLSLRPPGSHFYEVIAENRPCWLYFDLEFCKLANPYLDPKAVMAQFRATLSDFCAESGIQFDESTAVYFDSSTEKKFSSHVIVRRLAFENNRKAGKFVEMMISFSRRMRRRDSRRDLMFVRRDLDDIEATSSVIDASVYSKNRCFRLLWQSKFGKTAVLRLQDGGSEVQASDPPAAQLLRTLASFVPESTPFVEHRFIPSDLKHEPRRNVLPAELHSQLTQILKWLMKFWDDMRSVEKGNCCHAPTSFYDVTKRKDAEYRVSLYNNRYCCQRGRSHKSHEIWFSINVSQGLLRQHCFDKDDCRRRFKQFEIPPAVLAQAQGED
eukprot:TRINITY_DN3291_c0_g1_i1.p1 TRINITY_DN3291_c0_g1~~TRINITY_DN3291_c0_g1_i1.p1  ORF type:complete len:506 (+),score=76.31 TRINITY_DN3291_c0_g1_i1:52-1518(+)